MNWRRSEFIAILGPLATILLWVWFASAKANTWDGTSATVAKMEPVVEIHTSQLAVLNSKLDDIQDDLKWLRRHSKG